MSDPVSAQAPLVDAAHPWLGLLPFKEVHRKFFFGRDDEITEMLGRIRENSLTVLFGQSGLGKTSLLGAAVVPALREAAFAPVLLRLDYTASAPSLLEQTRAAFRTALPDGAWPEDAAATPLWEIFHRSPGLLPPGSPAPLLIFDQFEEIFTLGRQDPAREREAGEWLEQMADLLQNRPPRTLEDRFAENRRLARDFDFGASPLRIVFALREDYLSHLEGWKTRLPLLTQNRMALLRLNGLQALEAVLGPASLGEQSLISREVAAGLVRTVARVDPETPLPQIRAVPPLLSLLCEQLNVARLAAGAPEITAEMVTGQAQDILQRFYVESYAVFPTEHRETIRALIEDPPMITEGGYRNSLVREDAEAHLARLGVADPRAVFDTLIQRRLITAEEKDRVQRLEVTHDVLVPLLVRSRRERRDRVAKEVAERRLADEAAKTRKRRLLTAGLAVLTLSALAGAGFGWFQANIARDAAARAIHQEELAKAATRETKAKNAALEDQLHQASHRDFGIALKLLKEWQVQRVEPQDAGRNNTHRTKWHEAIAYLARSLEQEPLNSAAQAWLYRSIVEGITPDAHAAARNPAGPEFEQSVRSPDGHRILLIEPAGTWRLWDSRAETLSPQIRSGSGAIRAAQFSPDGHRIVTAGGDATVRIWEVANGRELASLRGSESFLAVAVSPDGRRVATAGADKVARIWDMATARLLGQPLRHEDAITTVAFSPDGTRMMTASRDNTIRLWDAATAQPLGEPMILSGAPITVTFTADGSRLFSAMRNGELRTWDSITGRPLGAPFVQDSALSALGIDFRSEDKLLRESISFSIETKNLIDSLQLPQIPWMGGFVQWTEGVSGLHFEADGQLTSLDPGKRLSHLYMPFVNAHDESRWAKLIRWVQMNPGERPETP